VSYDDEMDRDEVVGALRSLRVAQRPEAARRLVRWLDAILIADRDEDYQSAALDRDRCFAYGLAAALELPPDPVPLEQVLTVTRGGTIVSTGAGPARRLLLELFGEEGCLPQWVEDAYAAALARPRWSARGSFRYRGRATPILPIGLFEVDLDGVPALAIGQGTGHNIEDGVVVAVAL